MKRLLFVAFAVALWLSRGTIPSAQPPQSGRVVVVSFDGAADWIVDRLIAAGKAPAFERLARDGARAEAMLSVLPTLTAPAHATLWTGVSPRAHSVVGNSVLRLPRSAHSLLERQSGFDHGSAVEPIWAAASRAGRRSLVLQAAGTRLSDEFGDRMLQFDIYSRCSGAAIVEGRLPADAREAFGFRVEKTLIELRRDVNGIAVNAGGQRSTLLAERGRRFSAPIAVGGGSRAFRLGLVAYDPAQGRFKALRGRVCEPRTNRPDRLADFRRETGIIIGESVGNYYWTGQFGPTLLDGGKGDAEDLLVEVLEVNHEFFTSALRFAAKEPWDLLVTYVPTLDAMGHVLTGVLDPETMGHRKELADRMWPWMESLFARTIDAYVAEIRTRFPDASVVVVSDHGMEGSAMTVHPNRALREVGLLTLDSRGRISLAGTRAMYLYGNGGAVFINSSDRKNGIVGAGERETVKRLATSALLAIRDPLTGMAPVRAVFDTDVDGPALGVGGDASADLYFDLAPGYDLGDGLTGDRKVTAQRPGGSGEHGGAPSHRGLHAVFFAAGRGIAAGAAPGLVRAIDVAPTVASLMKLPVLPHAEGRALELSTPDSRTIRARH